MKIKPTETVTLDGQTYVVSSLPDDVKSLVDTYDEIRKDLENARVEYIKCQSALNDLGNQIAGAVKRATEPKADVQEVQEDAEEDSRSRI
jgi:septation ring formation regulator EzrA